VTTQMPSRKFGRRAMDRRSLFPVLALPLLAGWAGAQEPRRVSTERPPVTVTVTLAEALAQARANSPAYRQALNDAGPARWAVRSAQGALLPSLDVDGGLSYSGAGASQFGGSLFQQNSAALYSSYGIRLGLRLDGSTLLAPATQRASERAVEEDITFAGAGLVTDITTQYLAGLRATAQTEVARQTVQRNLEFLELARARQQVGQATLLDVRQAEVSLGQSEVEFLRARQAEQEAKLELFRRMGVELRVPVSQVALTDSFPLVEPAYDLDALLRQAEEQNPLLRAARARQDAAGIGVRSARSQYLPSLSLSAAWRGFTQEFTNTDLLIGQQTERARMQLANCEFQNALISALPGGGVPGYPNGGLVPDCRAFVGLDPTGEALLPENRQQIIDGNKAWPWDFRRQPFQASVSVSLPLFAGFSRNLSVARAAAAREDAQEAVRAGHLQVRTDVQGRWLGLQTAWEAIAVQDANRTAATDQLDLARERFRLGSGSALEVTDAETARARAEAEYVNAVYAYHQAIAALEFAVGRPLR
jgi:outer membrane protein TolC